MPDQFRTGSESIPGGKQNAISALDEGNYGLTEDVPD